MTFEEFKQNFLPELIKITSFAGKIRYAEQNLQRIGSGTGRVVYDIDGEKVLKLAKNSKGVAQNGAEANVGYYDDTHHIVTIIFDSGDDESWLISEKAKKVSEKRIKDLTGIPSLSDLYMYLRNWHEQNHGKPKQFHQDNEIIEFLNDNEFAIDLQNFLANYGQSPGDFNRASTFGEVLRDGQPTIVLTDYGLNDEVYNTHYNPQRKQKYQMYELYNFADGNDDILSDIGNTDEIRHGMWAQMPYSVSDGQGVINEKFINFVNKNNKYPKKPISGLPVLTDMFHECVNNIKEVLNVVENKKLFYNNLMELQNYLIETGFYDRDPLLSEEYQINEEIPKVKWMTLNDNDYATKLANSVCEKLNLSQPKFLGKGENGYAYEINDNLVLKLTADISEADSGLKLMRGNPKSLPIIFNVYKVVDTETNMAYFALLEENINEKPIEKFRKFDADMELINPQDGLNIFYKPMRRNFDYNTLAEKAKEILTSNPNANVSEDDRKALYNYVIGLLNIKQEMINFGIKSNDYTVYGNLGYKNGVLKYFDVGGQMGATEPPMSDDKIIYIPENVEESNNIDEDYNRSAADRIAARVGEKLNVNIAPMKGGNYGMAYDVGNNRVLKITRDNSEAAENLMLIGKPLKYIAQPYHVYEIKSNFDESIPKTWAIILEKLRTDEQNFKRLKERMDFAFGKIMNTSFADVVDYYLEDGEFGGDVDKEKVEKYMSRNPEDAKYFYGVLKIAEECKHYGIESMDYLNYTNLGYKPNGDLGFFDVGFGNGFLQPQNLEKIEVDEDSTSKFSTSNSVGRDDFPAYDNNDTSPSISNDLNANSSLYEDLEYNHVSDATKDVYELSEEIRNTTKIKLSDIYSQTPDEDEMLWNFIGMNGYENSYFETKKIKTSDVFLTYNQGNIKDSLEYANKGQLKIIEYYEKNIDKHKNDYFVVSTEDKILIDGYHKLIAFLNKGVLIINVIDLSSEVLSEDRDKSYMPDAQSVEVKKKCKLGGQGNTSTACNQGDINNLEFGSIDEELADKKYYRAIEKNMGETVEFEPEGYYEAIDDDGNPIWKYDTFWVSDKPEVAASKSIGGAVMGLYSMFMSNAKNPTQFFIYVITEKPDVDISHWDMGDFGHIKEVRYRRPVQGKYLGKVTITDDFKKRINAFYEIHNLEAYDEPDEETGQVFQDTDYEKYLDNVKNMVNETGEGNGESYEVNIIKSTDYDKEYAFRTEDDDKYIIKISRLSLDDNNWYVVFGIDNEFSYLDYNVVTNKGRMYKVMATISKIMRGFVINTKPDKIEFEPTKKSPEDRRRFSLYLQFIKKQLPLEYEYVETDGEILIQKKVESISKNINEAQLMSLQDLPFKQEVEQRGGKIFSIGGAVRDEFLGKESKDLDILITGVPLDELEALLSKYGRVDAVGKSFGVLKFKPSGATEDIDIAIPRTEKPSGIGGHQGFDITSDHALPIEKDLERRDFTINAIAKDIDGNIIDPYNGQEDLKNKIIRVVNPEAFSDDPLRMLRAIQFSSRFGFTIEPETMQMIIDNAPRVKEIAPERILTEFDKIIKKGSKLVGVELLIKTGLFEQIFGVTMKPSTLGRRDFDGVRTMGEFIFLMTYGIMQQPAEFFKNNLKGDLDSYKEIKALEMAFDNADASNAITARTIAHNMYVISQQSLQSQILPTVIETAAQELLQGKYPKIVNELAVNGNDLMQVGLKGKEIGDAQKMMLMKVYADKVRNDKEELLGLIQTKSTGLNEDVKGNNDWVNSIVEKLTSYYGVLDNTNQLYGLLLPIVKIAYDVNSFESFNEFLGSHTKYWDEENTFFPKLFKILNIDFENDFEREYSNIIGLMDSIFDENIKENVRIKLNENENYNFTEEDLDYCWQYHKSYLIDILNGEYDLDTAREDLRGLIGSQWDGRTKNKINENKNNQIEYGALMLFLDVPIWEKITSVIKKDDIYEKNGEFGIEDEPHVTILYGFHNEVSADDVFELYKENFELKPIEIGVEGISVFENEEFDVVKMDVNSEILSEMNAVMRKLPSTTKFPKYHAHITLAYVKKGKGKEYVKKFDKNRILTGDELVFSTKKEKKNKMKLTQKGLLKEDIQTNVLYSAIVLDNKSRNKLIKVFSKMIPEGYEIIAHHTTLNLGAIDPKYAKDLDKEIELSVIDYAIDDKVMAVGIEGYPTNNKKAHITIAVNRTNGGKPFMSNQLSDWKPIGFELKLTGIITEILK